MSRISLADLPSVELLTPEEMVEIFGAGLGRRLGLGVESLEGRKLMASVLTASLTGGVLRIEGTPGTDTIDV